VLDLEVAVHTASEKQPTGLVSDGDDFSTSISTGGHVYQIVGFQGKLNPTLNPTQASAHPPPTISPPSIPQTQSV
jgi:hypothetical protein